MTEKRTRKIHTFQTERENGYYITLDFFEGTFTLVISKVYGATVLSYVDRFVCEVEARRAYDRNFFLIEQDMWDFPMSA